MIRFLKKQPAVRYIILGFLITILLGSFLLQMPFSIKEGVNVRYIDSLATSVSSVCITGLVAVDIADNFTFIGQVIVALLIQIGGLGVTAIGAGIILLVNRKINLKEISLIKESLNLHSRRSIGKFLSEIFYTTILIELIGALINFFVFIQDFEMKQAIWMSIFHSISSFNNSGFDVIGGGVNLIPYKDNIIINLNTSILIILGGIGFLVIREIREKGIYWKKYSMHARVVIVMTCAMLVCGTLLIKLSEPDITWLGAFFFSVSSRTAGFSTYPVKNFTNATLFTLIILMFIGASPGSTGGGIKTTTFLCYYRELKEVLRIVRKKPFIIQSLKKHSKKLL